MAEVVYLLCAFTSFLCAALLWRGYRRRASHFLFWSAVCFVGLCANNVLLFVDLAVLPTTIDLAGVRNGTALASVSVFLFGVIRDVV